MRKCQIFTLLIVLTLAFGCKESKTRVLPSSGGKTCEVLVVCEKTDFNGAIGDTIRAYFQQAQLGLNQFEPLFSLANVNMGTFNDAKMFQTMRNIIIVDIDPQATTKFEAFKNVHSAPQIVFNFLAPSKEAFYKLLQEKRSLMLAFFYENEIERIQKTFRPSENTEITDRLKKVFGFSMVFPDGYNISLIKKNFAWIRKEAKETSQGVLIYTFPYEGENVFSTKNMIERRNEIVEQYVLGPTEGSNMTTETSIPMFYPASKNISFKGNYCFETRGLWKLERDFMGGPFVNYMFLDEKNKQVIMLDAYLYSPRKPKRDLLIQLEGIIHSFAMDTTSQNKIK